MAFFKRTVADHSKRVRQNYSLNRVTTGKSTAGDLGDTAAKFDLGERDAIDKRTEPNRRCAIRDNYALKGDTGTKGSRLYFGNSLGDLDVYKIFATRKRSLSYIGKSRGEFYADDTAV